MRFKNAKRDRVAFRIPSKQCEGLAKDHSKWALFVNDTPSMVSVVVTRAFFDILEAVI